MKLVDRYPGLRRLVEAGFKGRDAKTVIRHLYPPRVHDMLGEINLLIFHWEESAIPTSWVREFNKYLNGVIAPSRFVEKILLDSGVKVPVRVIPDGSDHIARVEEEPYTRDLPKGFRFLHVSSCFPRKGIDCLLEAYALAFAGDENVVLIVKTFSNPHHDIDADVAAIRERFPECAKIHVINTDLSDGQMLDLYRRCDAIVAPSRGEGFGLPMAEAMRLGKPVITTAFGGQTDFCTTETSWLVDYKFAEAQSHFGLIDSIWADPSVEHLGRVMREVYTSPDWVVKNKVAAANKVMCEEYSWRRTAEGVVAFVDYLRCAPLVLPPVSLGWVSTFNTRCGIAMYSKYLLGNFPDQDFDTRVFAARQDAVGPDAEYVVRCWNDRDRPSLDDLRLAVEEHGSECLVFQFNFGLFALQEFAELLDWANDRNIVTVVTFHATRDIAELGGGVTSLRHILPSLSRCDRLLVHTLDDLNYFNDIGLSHNSTLFPQGAHLRSEVSTQVARSLLGLNGYDPIIGMYGFLLPNKGILETIEAFSDVLNRKPKSLLLLVCALYPNPTSNETLSLCRAKVEALGIAQHVRFATDFLEEEESWRLLEAADLLVFPYQNSNESSSAAIRTGLAANRPTLVSPLEIFRDVRSAVHVLSGTGPQDIGAGILQLLDNPELGSQIVARQRDWLEARDWRMMAPRLANMITGLWLKKRFQR
jgi:glycosyltransferase involved in cell wall biosynthesis